MPHALIVPGVQAEAVDGLLLRMHRRIEVMHMIKKGQMKDFGKVPLSTAQQFYSLVS